MHYTSTVLFAGAGLMDCAIRATGGRVVQAVEGDETMAAQYAFNFPEVRLFVQSVQSVNPEQLEPTAHIHLSPPCTEASIANPKAVETESSISAASASLKLIESIYQRGGGQWLTLENVWGYRNFESFKLLLSRLRTLGYVVGYQKLNAADFGTPQNRKRLWLRAARPTYAPNPVQLSLLACPELVALSGQAQRVSWWQAIKHLIPSFPLTTLSARKIQQLPQQLKAALVSNEHHLRNEQLWQQANPSRFTRPHLEILLLGKENRQASPSSQPSFTITSNAYRELPVLIKRTGANAKARPMEATEPAPTVRAIRGRRDQFALLDNWEVRRLTPEALWIFQMYGCDFSYQWKPGSPNTIKCRSIGNGVAFLNAVSVLKSLVF